MASITEIIITNNWQQDIDKDITSKCQFMVSIRGLLKQRWKTLELRQYYLQNGNKYDIGNFISSMHQYDIATFWSFQVPTKRKNKNQDQHIEGRCLACICNLILILLSVRSRKILTELSNYLTVEKQSNLSKIHHNPNKELSNFKKISNSLWYFCPCRHTINSSQTP